MSTCHRFYWLLIVSRQLYWHGIILPLNIRLFSFFFLFLFFCVVIKRFIFALHPPQNVVKPSLQNYSPSLYLSLCHFTLSLFLILPEFLSVFLRAPLLKTVSALLLLHQKAVAKWRLTSAATTEEGLCMFSSWGQIPLKRAKLWSTISHCKWKPQLQPTGWPFPITVRNLFWVIYDKLNLWKWNCEVKTFFFFLEELIWKSPPPFFTFSLVCRRLLLFLNLTPTPPFAPPPAYTHTYTSHIMKVWLLS